MARRPVTDVRDIHTGEADAIRQFLDSQDRQYDEGHSLDARYWAARLNRRPSRVGRGYLALAVVIALELVAFVVTKEISLTMLAGCVAVLVLVVSAGTKLARSDERSQAGGR